MMEILAYSGVNWVDLIHYPHFGKPAPGDYLGPPILFVLLDFALFLFLCKWLFWKGLLGRARSENQGFIDEVAQAEALEAEAARLQEQVELLSRDLEPSKSLVREQILREAEVEKELILNRARNYMDLRHRETVRQMAAKRDLVIRRIRDDLLARTLFHLKAELPGRIQASACPELFEKGLNSTFGPMSRHEP